MNPAPKKQPQIIAPHAYPQALNRKDAARAAHTLRSAKTAMKAQTAMQAQIPALRAAILGYAEELEKAQSDPALVFEKAHEIRGFAETVGLVTTGRIAETLCRYMDDMARIAKPVDGTIVALHVAAIARAARTEDKDAAMGDAVAAELATLVAKRLTDTCSF
jgi:ATP/maltotriose-dependent transcriptional regulator MalT